MREKGMGEKERVGYAVDQPIDSNRISCIKNQFYNFNFILSGEPYITRYVMVSLLHFASYDGPDSTYKIFSVSDLMGLRQNDKLFRTH